MGATIERQLTPELACLAAARSLVDGGNLGEGHERDRIKLALTEVLSNALRHGGMGGIPIKLRISRRAGFVHVEVIDHGPCFECAEPPMDRARPGGLGLSLLGKIAERWAVKRTAEGCMVWFDVSVREPA